MQSEDERFARAKVSLATAVRILGVALPPVGGAVGAEHVSACGFDDHDGRLVTFNASKEGRHTAAVLFAGVEHFRLVHGDPHRQPRPQRQQLPCNRQKQNRNDQTWAPAHCRRENQQQQQPNWNEATTEW